MTETTMIEEGLQALVGARYYITRPFVLRMYAIVDWTPGLIVTVARVQVEGGIFVSLAGGDTDVLVPLEDLSLLLVPVPVPVANTD